MENTTENNILTAVLTAVKTVMELYNRSEDKNDSLYITEVMSFIKQLEESSKNKYLHMVNGKSINSIIYNYKVNDKYNRYTYKIGDKVIITKPDKKFRFLKGKKGKIMNIIKYNKKTYRQVFILMDDENKTERVKLINIGKPLHDTNDISWVGFYLAQIQIEIATPEEDSNNINRTFPDLDTNNSLSIY